MGKSNKKTILIAGGAGFVGSHLADFFIAQEHKVIVVDNLSTGSKQNVKNLLKHPNFKFIQADICKKNITAKVDAVFHLASPASPPHYQKDPIGTWKANTLGTLNLLELAKKNNAKFIFASTSEIYGDPLVHPQTESYWGNVNSVGLRSCYDESKRAGESLCMDFFRSFKMEIKVARIFNTYGPRMDKNDGRVVSNFIVQALKHKPLTLYGSGKQTRSFQYVDDLVSGFVKLMDSPKSFSGPVNLGNPGEFTIIELAKIISQLTGSEAKYIYLPLPKDDPQQRKPNIQLAKRELKWEPKINLQQGLTKTISYFASVL